MNSTGQSAPIDFNRIVGGIISAAKLDRGFFKVLESDPSYTQDAWVIVVAVSVISAVFSFLGALIAGNGIVNAVGRLLWTGIWGVAGFALWVYLVQLIGVRFFKGQGDFGEVQRCLGFAYGPQILGILAIIPCLGTLAALIGWVWSLVAGFVAIQESLDQDTGNAVATVVLSGIVVILINVVVGAVLHL